MPLNSTAKPQAIKPSETKAPEKTQKSEAAANTQSFRVLVVEDNKTSQMIACRILKTLNCQIDVAGTGEAAVEQAKTCCYDVIFMDIGLPDFSGKEAAQFIRNNINSLSQRSLIVALTAHSSEGERKACLDVKIDFVLHKPLTPVKGRFVLDIFSKLPE